MIKMISGKYKGDIFFCISADGHILTFFQGGYDNTFYLHPINSNRRQKKRSISMLDFSFMEDSSVFFVSELFPKLTVVCLSMKASSVGLVSVGYILILSNGELSSVWQKK